MVDAVPADRTLGERLADSADRIAFITGITGQDGRYLAEFLHEKGYQVHGLVRDVRARSEAGLRRPGSGLEHATLHQGYLEYFLTELLVDIQPTEIYNLAAASFVGKSWDEFRYYQKVNGDGAVNIFEAARRATPKARIYQASSSEMFGSSPPPQSEDTVFRPRSPYGASKVYAHNMARIYRESYGLHISCGICFNHESPRRGPQFVSRKIAQEVAMLTWEPDRTIALGDLSPKRDWGHARDYVRAMWMMLQAPEPDDYVVATGETHSVQEFLELACSYAGVNWRDVYVKDPKFIRPADIYDLRGDSSKIRNVLGWEPEVSFNDLVLEMVMYEMELLRSDESQRQAPAPLLGEFQSESGSEALRGGVSREVGGTEGGSEGIRSHPPDLKSLG